MYNNIRREGIKKMGPSSEVPSNGIKGNGHKLMHRKFRLNIKKSFFKIQVTEHWYRLPRQVVKTFKTHLPTVLSNIIWDDPG